MLAACTQCNKTSFLKIRQSDKRSYWFWWSSVLGPSLEIVNNKFHPNISSKSHICHIILCIIVANHLRLKVFLFRQDKVGLPDNSENRHKTIISPSIILSLQIAKIAKKHWVPVYPKNDSNIL